MNAYGISRFRLEVCSFEWSSQPTLVRPSPLSGRVRTGVGLWRGVLSHERAAALAEVGECGARLGCLFGGRRYACRRTTEGPVGVLVAFWLQRSLAAWVHRLPCTAMPARRTSTGGLLYRRRSTRPRVLALNSPSNGARLPAELKHITKRRKRNQQGCP